MAYKNLKTIMKKERQGGKELKITVDQVGKHPRLSIREWYMDEGIMKPGRGIALFFDEIDEMMEGMKEGKEFMDGI